MAAVAKIVAMFGPCRGVAREVDRGLVVGRAAEAGLQLIDDKVSREHCSLEPARGGFVVRDLGSRNGTFLNGHRVDGAAPLNAGDQIAVGESVLVFEPTFEALLARDGESTLLLTQLASPSAVTGPEPVGGDLERAGALALRAALANTTAEAGRLLADALWETLAPTALSVLVRDAVGNLKPAFGRPAGSQVAVGRALLDLAVRQGRAVAAEQAQSSAETDAQTTRVRVRGAHVLCAPFHASGNVAGVVCVVREGAFDAVELSLAGALTAAAGPALVRAAPPPERPALESPVAESAAMREAMRLAAAAAQVNSTVLITGETGTGKEELARAVHGLGTRAAGPFIALNCGAIPAELAESELFGHEKGAFTGAFSAREGVFEQADGGTLFLDEIGDLPATLQVKLLRAVQDRRISRVGGKGLIAVDVRIVAATHKDLAQEVERGAFREDLFWRLNVLRIHLPPLRDRPEDILPLAERFSIRLGRSLGRAGAGFTPEARKALQGCRWPGNARQLANAIERALVMRETAGPLGLADLPPEVLAPDRVPAGGASAPGGGRNLGELVRALEREQILLALKRAQGVKVAAAEALGISRPTLDRKIDEYGINLFE